MLIGNSFMRATEENDNNHQMGISGGNTRKSCLITTPEVGWIKVVAAKISPLKTIDTIFSNKKIKIYIEKSTIRLNLNNSLLAIV